MTRRPIFIAFGLFLVVAVGATIALLTGDEQNEEAQALDLPAEPAWSAPGGPGFGSSPVVRDGMVLVHELDAGLSLRDAATGEVRWTVEPEAELPGGDGRRWRGSTGAQFVTHDDRLAVLVSDYGCESCTPSRPTDLGIALLSGEDGSVVWRTTVLTAEQMPEDDQPYLDKVVAGDGLALVGLAADEGPGGSRGRMIAHDFDSGAVLWELADVWPLAAVGDVVLTVSYPFSDSGQPGSGGLSTGRVAAVSAATGKPLWDLADQYDRSELVLTAGDVALVRAVEEDKRHPRGLVVTLDRGQVLEEFGYGDLSGCAADERTLIVCPRDGDLWTFQVADGKVRTIDAEVRVDRVNGIAPDRIYVVASGDNHSIDYDGALVDQGLPGDFLARGDDWVLFLNHDQVDLAPTPFVRGYRIRP